MQFAPKLDQIEERFDELTRQLADPTVISDAEQYRKAAKAPQRAGRSRRAKYREWKQRRPRTPRGPRRCSRSRTPNCAHMAERGGRAPRAGARAASKSELKVLLLPKDPNDEKNVVLEIRAGTGGDEATLFAAEIFRMYSRYAEIAALEGRSHLARASRPWAG